MVAKKAAAKKPTTTEQKPAADPNPVKGGVPKNDATTGEPVAKAPKEPAAADPNPVEHGVPTQDAAGNKLEKTPVEKAAADPNPVKKGMPTDPAPDAGDVAAPTKAELKLSELADEFERLKAEGNPNPERLAELKKLLAKG